SRTLRTQALQLEGQTRQLSSFVEQMPAVVWRADAELLVRETGGAGLRNIGLRPNADVGRPVAEVFGAGGPDHPALSAHRRSLSGEVVGYEFEFAGHVFQACVQPLRVDARVVGVVGAAFDVTD